MSLFTGIIIGAVVVVGVIVWIKYKEKVKAVWKFIVTLVKNIK